MRHRLIKRKIKITHNNNFTSNQQTIIQNHQQNFRFLNLLHFQHSREILVSFRSVSLSNLSASMTFNEFVTTTSEPASMKFLMNSLKRPQYACVRFFTFSQSTSKKMNLLQQRYESNDMTWKNEKQQSMWICYALNSARFFRNRLFVVHVVNDFSVSKFAVNQNAPINKNSKNSNSKNLKQHTFAKSISLCFCFCFVREIDRFIILICKYLSHRSRSKFSTKFSTKFSFSSHIFIFLLLAHFLLSNLFLHVYRICFDIFNVNHD